MEAAGAGHAASEANVMFEDKFDILYVIIGIGFIVCLLPLFISTIIEICRDRKLDRIQKTFDDQWRKNYEMRRPKDI